MSIVMASTESVKLLEAGTISALHFRILGVLFQLQVLGFRDSGLGCSLLRSISCTHIMSQLVRHNSERYVSLIFRNRSLLIEIDIRPGELKFRLLEEQFRVGLENYHFEPSWSKDSTRLNITEWVQGATNV